MILRLGFSVAGVVASVELGVAVDMVFPLEKSSERRAQSSESAEQKCGAQSAELRAQGAELRAQKMRAVVGGKKRGACLPGKPLGTQSTKGKSPAGRESHAIRDPGERK